MKRSEFFGEGLFQWQISSSDYKKLWQERRYDENKYWGEFPRNYTEQALPSWAIGPFKKYEGNPVFAPSEQGWDRGHISGGVHNGSILFRNGKFYYIYRGESPAPCVRSDKVSGDIDVIFDYICDIGIAVSDDGVHFTRIGEGLFRKGKNEKYSFEDVCCVEKDGRYYLFCNRWYWQDPVNPAECGVFLATSTDLIHWKEQGLVFPQAARIHRNACVVQDPQNCAVKIDGKYLMYMNDGLLAYSDDLLHWNSREIELSWPGGEGCFALADYNAAQPDNILLFTGGHHCGHFYAIGEVLFHKDNPSKPLDWLKRPALYSSDVPYEQGFSCKDSNRMVSAWQDTVFFTGLTRHGGKWLCYYGGSEYYTCLAEAEANNN